MEDNKKQNGQLKTQDTNKDYDPTNRDFQRTEEDIDNVSKSEKEELEKRKQRTHEASTKPDRNHIG